MPIALVLQAQQHSLAHVCVTVGGIIVFFEGLGMPDACNCPTCTEFIPCRCRTVLPFAHLIKAKSAKCKETSVEEGSNCEFQLLRARCILA